jgi:hypothetical protein
MHLKQKALIAIALSLLSCHAFAQAAKDNKKEPCKPAAEEPAIKDAARADMKKSDPR